jgi:hypothetical protein
VKAGKPDAVLLRDPVPGTYTVAVQSVLTTDPSVPYEARATVVEAAGLVGFDGESLCGLEDAGPVRSIAETNDLRDIEAAGNPAVVLDEGDPGDVISLDVLVILDGTTREHAEAIFSEAAASYAPLDIDLHVVEYREHSFAPMVDGLAINAAARNLLGGHRPDGIDIVEILTDRDIQQLGQPAVAGIADCIGGVAYGDRAFVTAESATPQDVAVGPVVFDYRAQAHVTAHEIGHLMGGQHHYANCVEGIEASDAHDDGTVEASPCSLMFNAADLLGTNFGEINGRIVRAMANRYAR